jgi:hypothetical protein
VSDKQVFQITLPKREALALFMGYNLAMMAATEPPPEQIVESIREWRKAFGYEFLKSLHGTITNIKENWEAGEDSAP